jgi:hypothetical protein
MEVTLSVGDRHYRVDDVVGLPRRHVAVEVQL